MANILVYALHYDGAINKNSLGAVSEGAKLAAELGGEAHAILLGENVPQELAASLGKYGAKKVLVADGPEGLARLGRVDREGELALLGARRAELLHLASVDVEGDLLDAQRGDAHRK